MLDLSSKVENYERFDSMGVTKLKHITYRLEIIDDRLEFQILEMDERFRCSNNGDEIHFESQNGVYVKSYLVPEIEDFERYRTIWLRGFFETSDKCTRVLKGKSPGQLKTWEKTIHEALKDWDQNWGGWSE